MPSPGTAEAALLQQQDALAKFGELALRSDDLDEILTEACRLVGGALGTDLAKVLEMQEDRLTLKVRAGVGWKPGVVGKVIVRAEKDSSEGYALQTGAPVTSDDIDEEVRFKYPEFLRDNGVRALVNVSINGSAGRPPFGILQVDSRTPRKFGERDTNFLRSYANLLGAAVDRLRVAEELRETQTCKVAPKRDPYLHPTGTPSFLPFERRCAEPLRSAAQRRGGRRCRSASPEGVWGRLNKLWRVDRREVRCGS